MNKMQQATQIIAIANQKGVVGKTTTSINLATAISAIGKKTLIIDLDPQGNSSTGLGIANCDRNNGIYEALTGQIEPIKCINKTLIPGLSIISANVNLAAAEIELIEMNNREYILKNILTDLAEHFEVIIIDCPPSLGLLTINALTVAKGVIIPLQCEFFALEGLVHLMNTISLIRKAYNPELQVDGILLTMVDRRNKLSLLVEQDVRDTFKELVFKTIIPRNIKLSEAPSHGKPALIYDNKCGGSLAYIMLAKEILTRKNLINDNSGHSYERKESVG